MLKNLHYNCMVITEKNKIVLKYKNVKTWDVASVQIQLCASKYYVSCDKYDTRIMGVGLHMQPWLL